jgi:hypothetical protein
MAGSSNGDRPGTDRGPDRRGTRPKSPVDQWFEVFVYAPLGFALDARQLFPRFVDRGRSQVVLARVIGKYAVKHGSHLAGDRLSESQSQIAAVLQTLGWLPEEDEGVDPAHVEAFESDAVVFQDGPAARPEPSPDTPPVDAEARGADVTADPIGVAAAIEVDDLAIPDYDNLSASQVVPRLAGLSADELESVRRYETSRRGRKTILSKIAQLQSA